MSASLAAPSAAPGRATATGREIYDLIARLYPICRSITGDGLRETFRILGEHIPLEIHEVPTGTPVLDWTVPKEWNIRDGWVRDASGRKVVDFARSNLSVMSYSLPVRARMTLAELRPHLFSLPEHPGWIPYRTSYYREDWGFCLAHEDLLALEDGEYEVCIDSELTDGRLTYAELLVPGAIEDEILLSCHACHPSLCNDGLSGMALYTLLARDLMAAGLRHSVRVLFLPVTIGAITWLARNEAAVGRIRHGLIASCVGDRGHPTYKKSRRGDADIDRAAAHVLHARGTDHTVKPFIPYGYDERQFCSPGFNLPVGAISRTPHGAFPEYHTSADDLDLVDPDSLEDSYRLIADILFVIDSNGIYRNLKPKGEPQLGRRGLYGSLGGLADRKAAEMAMLWVLNLSDGAHSLLDIAEEADMDFRAIHDAAMRLKDHALLAEC